MEVWYAFIPPPPILSTLVKLLEDENVFFTLLIEKRDEGTA